MCHSCIWIPVMVVLTFASARSECTVVVVVVVVTSLGYFSTLCLLHFPFLVSLIILHLVVYGRVIGLWVTATRVFYKMYTHWYIAVGFMAFVGKTFTVLCCLFYTPMKGIMWIHYSSYYYINRWLRTHFALQDPAASWLKAANCFIKTS